MSRRVILRRRKWEQMERLMRQVPPPWRCVECFLSECTCTACDCAYCSRVESADPYCAAHGLRFDPAVGCPSCLAEL